MGQCFSVSKRIRTRISKLVKHRKNDESKITTPALPPALKKYFPEDGEDENLNAIFGPVFSKICLDKLPGYISLVRKNQQESRRSTTTDEILHALDPTICSPALFGSMHVAFVIQFTDGLRWLLKVPATGHPDRFTQLQADTLTSEALTMRLLKRETTVPIPSVYAFDNSFTNPLECPFILMEFVDGVPLSEYWFDESIPKATLEDRRETSLREVAFAMQQMNQFTFSQGGSPLFDVDEKSNGVGPWKELDFSAMWLRPDIPAVYCQTGPFPNLESYLRSVRRVTHPIPADDGYHKLLELFIDLIPSSANAENHDFVLTHTDLNLQNILVSPEGHLISLIDWDGVAAVPRRLGNERYPDWLIRDWNPLLYDYSSEPDAINCHMDSPQDLARYRSMYEQYVLQARRKMGQGGEEDEDSTTKTTRNSLVLATLKEAADQYVSIPNIVNKIYKEILRYQTKGEVTDARDLPYTNNYFLFMFTDALEEEGLDEDRLQWIKEGFQGLFE